jgi:hypothetical protein
LSRTKRCIRPTGRRPSLFFMDLSDKDEKAEIESYRGRQEALAQIARE